MPLTLLALFIQLILLGCIFSLRVLRWRRSRRPRATNIDDGDYLINFTARRRRPVPVINKINHVLARRRWFRISWTTPRCNSTFFASVCGFGTFFTHLSRLHTLTRCCLLIFVFAFAISDKLKLVFFLCSLRKDGNISYSYTRIYSCLTFLFKNFTHSVEGERVIFFCFIHNRFEI